MQMAAMRCVTSIDGHGLALPRPCLETLPEENSSCLDPSGLPHRHLWSSRGPPQSNPWSPVGSQVLQRIHQVNMLKTMEILTLPSKILQLFYRYTPHKKLKFMVVLRIPWGHPINVRFLIETLNMTGDMGISPVIIPSDL